MTKLTLNDVLRAFNYQITEGTKYCWDSYGPDAWVVECLNSSVTFDTFSHIVYSISCHPQNYTVDDEAETISWVNPEYEVANHKESLARGFRPNKSTYSLDSIMMLCGQANREEPIDSSLINIIDVDFSNDPELLETLKTNAILEGRTLEEYVEMILPEAIKYITELHDEDQSVIEEHQK